MAYLRLFRDTFYCCGILFICLKWGYKWRNGVRLVGQLSCLGWISG